MSLDETEGYRRMRAAELNVGRSRQELEKLHGRVWSTEELRQEWEVLAFMAPLIAVRSLDKQHSGGSFEFQHSPRFYFNFLGEHTGGHGPNERA